MLEKLKKRNNKLFLVFIVFAFYLRLQSINYGLPYVLNPSEASNLFQTINLFRNLPGYLFSPEGVHISPLYLLLSNLISFISTHNFNLIKVLEINPGSILVPLRFISVLFDLFSIVILYLIGLRFSPFVALISSALLSASMIHVRFSQIFSPISAVTFFGLLAVYFILKMDESKKNVTFSAYSVLAAFLIHPIGILNIIPLIFVLLERKIFNKYKSLISKILLIGLIVNLNFVLHLPNIFLDYIKSYFFYHSGSYLLYLFNFVIIGVGPVAYFSILLFLKYKKDYDINLIKVFSSFVLLFVGIAGFFHFTDSAYSMLIVPYFCIYAGLAFNSILERSSTNNKQFAFIVLMLLLFWIPLKYTFKYNKINSLSDTRAEATEWVKQNTNEDYRIVWDKNSIQPNWYDPYNKEDIKHITREPELLVNRQKYIVSNKLLKDKNWFKILRKKVDYVVINSIDYEYLFRNPVSNIEKKYYRKILKQKPLIVFNPYLKELDKNTRTLLIEDLYSPVLTLWQRERSGPVIRIYKL